MPCFAAMTSYISGHVIIILWKPYLILHMYCIIILNQELNNISKSREINRSVDAIVFYSKSQRLMVSTRNISGIPRVNHPDDMK